MIADPEKQLVQAVARNSARLRFLSSFLWLFTASTAIAAPGVVNAASAKHWSKRCDGARLRTIVAGWQLCIVPTDDPNGELLTIGHGERVSWSHRDVVLGGVPTETAWPTTIDINGNGIPDLIVGGWNGGGTCCRTDLIVELAPERVRVLAMFDMGRAGKLNVQNGGEGALPEVTVTDWVAGIEVCYGGRSLIEEVVMAWNGRAFCPRRDEMRWPLDEIRELLQPLSALRKALGEEGFESVPCEVWHDTLRLVYAGQAAEAGIRVGELASIHDFSAAIAYLFAVREALEWQFLSNCVDSTGLFHVSEAGVELRIPVESE